AKRMRRLYQESGMDVLIARFSVDGMQESGKRTVRHVFSASFPRSGDENESRARTKSKNYIRVDCSQVRLVKTFMVSRRMLKRSHFARVKSLEESVFESARR